MSIAPNVTMIPAKAQTDINRSKYQQLRVAAYCRVSTAEEEQQNSYQVQISYYTDLINRKKEWTLVKVFADEGISGTQTKKRTEFNRMIRMCKNKKIEIKLAYLIQRIGTEYLKNRRNKGFRHIWRDRKPFSFYDSSYSDMKQK